MNKFTAWTRQRLDRSTPDGWILTASLIIAGLGLAGFAGVLQGVHETDMIAAFDKLIGQIIIGLRSGGLTAVFEVLTGLAGSRAILLLLGLTAALLYKPPYRQLPVILLAGAIVEAAIVLIVKVLVARPRPDQAFQLVHETSFSFPSGHTMAAVVIYGLLAYFIARTVVASRRWLVFGLWLGFAAGVAVSRIYLGIHYPSDTLASACLGGAGLSLGLAWTRHHTTGLNPEAFDRHARNRILMAISITVIAVVLWRPLFI